MPIAFILVNTAGESFSSVLETLRKMDTVEEAYRVHTHGTCDIVAKVETKTMKELSDIVVQLRFLDEVQSTLTLLTTEEPE